MKKIFLAVLFGMALAALVLSVVNFTASRRSAEETVSSIKTHTDSAVRRWLNVSSLVANYTFPEDAKFYYVTWLEFDEGKLANEKLIMYIKGVQLGIMGMTVEPDEPVNEKTLRDLLEERHPHLHKGIFERTLRVELLWSTDTPEILFWIGGSSVKIPSEFWMKLDGGISPNIQEVPYNGFTILGSAASRLNQKGEVTRFITPLSLEDTKYVGALAIKTFATEEELKADLESLHKIWDVFNGEEK